MDSKNTSTSSVKSSTSTFSKKQTKSVQMVSQSSTDSTGHTTTTASVSAKASKDSSKSMEHSESIDGQTRKEVSESRKSATAVMKSTQHHQHSLEGLNKEILALTGGTPEDFVFKPFFNTEDRMLMNQQSQSFEDITNRQIARQDDIFEMKVNVQDYEPEDIQVKVTDDLVTIQGKTEKRIDENNFKSVQFSKKFTIPPGVIPETIACSLSKTKVLTLSAPIKGQKQNLAQIQQTDSKESLSKLQQKDIQSQTKHQQIMNESSRQSSVSSDVSTNVSRSSTMDEVVYQPKFIQNIANTTSTKDIFVEKITIDATKFKAEEISVKVTKNLVRVEGNHKDEFSSRSFYKEFTLPYGVKPENLHCTFSPDGSLTISGPIDTPKHSTQIEKQHQTTQEIQQSVQQQKQVTQTQQQQVRQEVAQTKQVVESQQQTQVNKQQQQQQITNERNTDIAKIQSADSIFSDTTATSLSRDTSISTVPSTPTEDGLLFRPMVSRMQDEQSLDSTKIFREKVVVKGYKAEEITVKVTKTSIVRIEGKHVEQFSSKSFYKEFTLPYGVKPESIQCSFSPENETLTIQAPIRTEVQQQIESTQHQQVNVAKSQQQVQQTQEQHVKQQKTTVHQATKSICTKSVIEGQEQLTYQPRVTQELQAVDTTKTFVEKLEVKNYKSEEITVKVTKNVIRVEGNHKEQFSSRSFYKEYILPKEVNPETLDVVLSSDGFLTITAPLNASVSNTQAQQQLVQQRQEVAHQQNQNQQVESTSTQQQQVSRTEQRNVTQSHTVESRSVQQQQSSFQNSDSVSSMDSLQSQRIQPIVDLSDKTNFNALTDFEDVSKQLCLVQEHQKFEMKLNVAEYKPEELQVKISNNMVTIQGKQEVKTQNSSSSRSFYKKFTIPPGVKPEAIVSSLSSSGVLTISAPGAQH